MTDHDCIEKLIKGELSLDSLSEEEKDNVLLYLWPRIGFIQRQLLELTDLRDQVFVSSPKLKREWEDTDWEDDDPDGNKTENHEDVAEYQATPSPHGSVL